MIRVVVTGSECTGKTTLAADLAARLSVPWVPEYVREYVAELRSPPTYADVDAIARGQMAAEDRTKGAVPKGLRTDRRLVVLDTDLLSTIVYSHHYYGDCPAWISAELERRRADLYLLAGIDVPWVEDGNQRDRGDRREEMQALFRETLLSRGLRFAPVHGDRKQRVEEAVAAIAELSGT